MDGLRVDWSYLPTHLLPLIAKDLKTHIQVLQFRSVCSSWRSSIPLFRPPIPPRFPFPYSEGPDAFLSQFTVYLLRPVSNPDPSISSSPSSSSSSASKGWLLKIEESDKLRLLNPITSCRIRYSNDSFPNDLNILGLNMVELCKAYALKSTNGSGSVADLNKVVVAPNSKDCAIFAIHNQGKLGFAKSGDDKLTPIEDQISDYRDMIVYKGQCYVVDRWGTVFWIDSSLKVVQFSPLLVGFGHRKHLVECCGELYVVDRYLDQEANSLNYNQFRRRRPGRRRRPYNPFPGKAVDFKVYKLDEEWGRWVDVKSLGDQVFFLTSGCCFSVSARELDGCKGNCIYFTDQNDIGRAVRDSNGSDGSVFSLEDHSIVKLGSSPVYSRVFWPPSTGLLGTSACVNHVLSALFFYN